MKPVRILTVAGAAGAAALAALALASSGSPPAARGADEPAFDPLFAPGASCTPARAGRPPLLDRLVLAQAETAPFKPGQAAPPSKGGKTADSAAPPLYTNLGKLHVPVSTASQRAQAYFDQGMRLTFSFNHAEAARAFRAAQQHDPGCAMCYWGEALVLGPNINAPMFPEAAAPAAAAAAKAV